MALMSVRKLTIISGTVRQYMQLRSHILHIKAGEALTRLYGGHVDLGLRCSHFKGADLFLILRPVWALVLTGETLITAVRVGTVMKKYGYSN